MPLRGQGSAPRTAGTRRALAREGARTTHRRRVAPQRPSLLQAVPVCQVAHADDDLALSMHKVQTGVIAPSVVRHVEHLYGNALVLGEIQRLQHPFDIAVELHGFGSSRRE
jgi:hypothetical protein